MKTRILVAALGIPVLIAVVLWGPEAVMAAALALLAAIAGWELQTCVSGGKNRILAGMSAVFAAVAVGWSPRPDLPALLTLVIPLFFAWAILQAGKIKFDQLMAALFSGTGIAYSFSVFLRMEASGFHRVWLLLPFVLSFACDTGAYFAGRFLGRHKLAPIVSPHKTVEGAVGGMLGNLAGGLVFALIAEHAFGEPVRYGAMTALALVCGAAAQIGDLSFSLVKRQYGIKDYGHLFLEHGGVLDRFDSVLFVAPLVELLLALVRR